MEEFLSNILILIGTLGYNSFEQISYSSKKGNVKDIEEDLFYISATRGAKGFGKATSEGFVVFEKSQVADPITDSYPKSMLKFRDELINEGIIKKIDNKLLISKDYLFSSSSTAAMIIMGRSANGLVEWKLKDGTTLRDYETAVI